MVGGMFHTLHCSNNTFFFIADSNFVTVTPPIPTKHPRTGASLVCSLEGQELPTQAYDQSVMLDFQPLSSTE